MVWGGGGNLRTMFQEIKVNEHWRRRYNKELMQLFGGLAVLLLVRINRLYWSGDFNRMDSKSQVRNNNPKGSRLRGRPKSRWWNCVHILINSNLQTGKRDQKQS